MIFQKIQDYQSPVQANYVLGGNCKFDISREYPIESLYLVVSVTVSAVAATLNADGLLNLIRKIQFTGNDQGTNRTPIDISGPSLIELAYHYGVTLDRFTVTRVNAAAIAAGPTTYEMVFPLFAVLPQVPDPLGSTLLLPVDRFSSNPSLNVTFATQAEMDTNAVKTFAFTALSCGLVVNRRIVDRKNWPIIDWDLTEQTVPHATTGDNLMYDIPVGGQYTGILLRSQTGTAAAPARGDISPAGADFDIRQNKTVIRRFRLLDLQRENDQSNNSVTYLNGSYFLDFVTDRASGLADPRATFGGLLNANIPLNSGTRLSVRQNVTGNTGAQITYVMHRLHGNLKDFKY